MPVALVSGANRGIGREIANQLARDHGFLVLAGARDPSTVEAGEKSSRSSSTSPTTPASVRR